MLRMGVRCPRRLMRQLGEPHLDQEEQIFGGCVDVRCMVHDQDRNSILRAAKESTD